jgi:ribosomal protein S18 acetylase RimI-like enzyme
MRSLIRVRNFRPSDAGKCVEILELNGQYSHPDVDGPEAMIRIYERQPDLFWVAEYGGSTAGFVRGVYDGSRALIWQLSVHPIHQVRGIGTSLVGKISKVFKDMGASSVSVTATERSKHFYERLEFRETRVKFMVAEDIDKVIECSELFLKSYKRSR